MSTAPTPTGDLDDRPSRGRTRLGLALILLVSLALRLGPIDHGMPANYVPDTHVVKSALGMAKDKNPVPEVGLYSSYPNLLPYMLLPVYATQYVGGRALGAWGSAEEFGNHALEHPETVHLPARVLVASLSALLPLVAFGAARAMGLGLGAWVAAWLAATGLLGVHFSTQERPWEPMVLFMLLAAWPAARYVTGGSRRALLLSGAAAGLSFGCHQGGAAALLIPAVAWLVVALRERADLAARLKGLLFDGLAAVGAFLVVGLVLGHPYLLVHGSTDTSQVVMGDDITSQAGAISIGGQGWILGLRPESFVRLASALCFYDPVLVLLGLAGLVLAWRRASMWPALAFLLAWGLVFLFSTNDHVRYLLPLAGLLCLPAGLAAERAWAWSRSSQLGGLGDFGLGVLLLLPLVQATRFAVVLDREDSRALAGRELVELLPEGARLGIGRYGPDLPLSLESLERLAELRELGSREAYRRAYLASMAESGHDPDDPAIGPVGGSGIDAIRLEDLFEFDDRRGSYRVRQGLALGGAASDGWSARQVLDHFGVTHVVLADKTPGDGELSLLIQPKAGWQEGLATPEALEVGDLLDTWGLPGALFGMTELTGLDARAHEPVEARLPTDLDRAGATIWDVERPGPGLYLFEL